nr:hypothetical protein [Tanacetum cinerariifolium]
MLHTESEGFKRIIDFLNANHIKYALTVNPTIYTSCIEKFWATTTAKNINGEAQIHSKVDGKKFIISEATIFRDLKFEDEGGVDCLSNEVIFEQCPLMEIIIHPSTSKPWKKQNPWKTRRQDTQETQPSDRTDEALNEENAHAQSNDLPLVQSSTEEQSLGEEDASKQGRNIVDIDANAEITLVDETAEDQGRYDDQEMFDTNITTTGIEETISTAALITTADVTPNELTMAQALVEIKKSIPKGATITTTVTTPTPDGARPKARDEKKDQINFDEQEARRLQAENDEQDRLAEEETQLIEDENLAWDNVQAMMDADYELAARPEEKRRKPLTKAQKRNQICVYLKTMAGFTHNQLKNKSLDEFQKTFNKTMSWINSFVPMDSKVVKDKAVLIQESNSKRSGDKLDKGRSKKQKLEDDKESEVLKRCLEIIPDDEDDVTIDATPLSIKTPIIDYKIYKEGKIVTSKFLEQMEILRCIIL